MIGSGEQGSVFKVIKHDDPSGKVYAAKIYKKSGQESDQTIFEIEIFIYSILPESNLLGKLVEYFDEDD